MSTPTTKQFIGLTKEQASEMIKYFGTKPLGEVIKFYNYLVGAVTLEVPAAPAPDKEVAPIPAPETQPNAGS